MNIINSWNETDWNALPKKGKYIDWKKSVGYKLNCTYNNMEFEIKIINYIPSKQTLVIKYNDKEPFYIRNNAFKRCRLGEYLLNRSKHKKNIGEITVTNTCRKLKIMDCFVKTDSRGYRDKWYKYRCLNCGYNGEMREGNLLNGQGCSCCCSNPKVVVEGINDIPTTAPWMVKYFQGGYDEAKLYTKSSDKKIKPICPDCERIKNKSISISNIYINHSIACSCGDGLSYPEKFLYSILEQLKLNFDSQLNKTTFNWCKNYKYDFYISSFNCIIETHGRQHYDNTNRGKSLKEEQENDRLKEQLAKQNGVGHYIVIDCRKSELDWIKNSVLNSKLGELFDLSDIDWNEAEKFTTKNLIREICIYKNNNKNLSANKISKYFKMGVSTISTYLKKGTELGWCNYDPKKEMKNSAKKTGKLNGKQVEMFKDGVSLGVFENCHELDKISKAKFNVKLNYSSISRVCRGEIKQCKGYIFKYTKKEEFNSNVQ